MTLLNKGLKPPWLSANGKDSPKFKSVLHGRYVAQNLPSLTLFSESKYSNVAC